MPMLMDWCRKVKDQTEDRPTRLVGRILLDLDSRGVVDLFHFTVDENEDIITAMRKIIVEEVTQMDKVVRISASTTIGLGG